MRNFHEKKKLGHRSSWFITCAVSLTACTGTTAPTNETTRYDDAAKLFTEVKTTQYFTEEKVAEEDIKQILSANVNSPSDMNMRPWHFTAVTDEETVQKLSDAMNDMKPPVTNDSGSGMPDTPPAHQKETAPPEGGPENAPNAPEDGTGFSKASDKAGIGDAPLTIVISCEDGSELSAGIAVQNMSAEAQLLGYETKIIAAPTLALDPEEYKALLSIPDAQKIAAVLIIGKAAFEEDHPDVVSSATIRNNFDDIVTIIRK